MPSWVDYGLTKNDAGDLINYIRSLNPPSTPAAAPAPRTIAALTPGDR